MKKLKKKLATIPGKVFSFIKRKWKTIIIVLLIIAGLAYYQYQKIQKNKPQLTFQKPEIKALTKKLEVSGIVDAKQKANLRFIAGGKVTYLGAKEGDWVKKWQTIATIDLATLKKQLEQDLHSFEREFNTWEQNYDDTKDESWKQSVRRNTESYQTDLDDTVLDVEIRDIAIRNSSLYAPFDGILTHSPTEVAGVQLLSTDYFEIINPETLVFKGQVDEADIRNVQLGQTAELELDAYEDEIINTTVNYISFTSNQTSSGTIFIVEFPLESNINKFRLGMNGDIAIILDTKENILTIPFDATRERDDKIYVDVRTGEDTYEERQIKTGLETDDEVEILEGLSEQDEILIPE